MVIYADSLLLVNFSMDFLSLYLTARLTKQRLKPLRMAAAAGIGAGFALATALIDAHQPSLWMRLAEGAASMGCAMGMTRMAFGGKLKQSLLFGAVNLALGGVMTACLSALERVFGVQEAAISPDASPLLFFFIAAVSGGVSLLYGRFRQREKRCAEVTILAFGRTWTLNMLVDSGNLLHEPISGKAVILVSDSKLHVEESELLSRLRLIPARSIGGEQLLRGFLPDKVLCEGRELDAVIALDGNMSEYDRFAGIFPANLLV